MNGIAVLVACAALGVDYGWQPAADGQIEYIIQIEPVLLDGLRTGQEIVSEVPPEVRQLRRFRIRVGTGQVPRIGQIQNPAPSSSIAAPGSVLPPNRNGGGQASPMRGGFLNLPPPPSLMEADGKSSVLVRPPETNGISSPATSPSSVSSVAPPVRTGSGSVPRPNSGSSMVGISPPMNSTGTSAGVFPPSTSVSSSFPIPPTSVGPPDGGGVFPPGVSNSVVPVPEPSVDANIPAPIRVGQADMKPEIDEETAKKLQAKPWTPLVLTSLALFASIAANIYLGWVAIGIYRRYRDMVDELHQAHATV